jgi:hypothetical protein
VGCACGVWRHRQHVCGTARAQQGRRTQDRVSVDTATTLCHTTESPHAMYHHHTAAMLPGLCLHLLNSTATDHTSCQPCGCAVHTAHLARAFTAFASAACTCVTRVGCCCFSPQPHAHVSHVLVAAACDSQEALNRPYALLWLSQGGDCCRCDCVQPSARDPEDGEGVPALHPADQEAVRGLRLRDSRPDRACL